MGTRTAESTVRFSYSALIANLLSDGVTSVSATHAKTLLSSKLNSGVNSGESDRCWESTRTLAANATETLDLFRFSNVDIGAGTGRDAVGQELTMEEIVGIVVYVDPASLGKLEILAATSSPMNWVGVHSVANGGALPAGGILFKWAPADNAFNQSQHTQNLKFTADNGAVTYTVFLVGRSSDDDESSSSTSSSTSSSSSSRSSLSSTSSLSSQSSHSISSLSSSSSSTSSASSVSSSSSSTSSSSTSSSLSSSSSSSVSSSSSSSISSSSSSSLSSSSSSST